MAHTIQVISDAFVTAYEPSKIYRNTRILHNIVFLISSVVYLKLYSNYFIDGMSSDVLVIHPFMSMMLIVDP